MEEEENLTFVSKAGLLHGSTYREKNEGNHTDTQTRYSDADTLHSEINWHPAFTRPKIGIEGLFLRWHVVPLVLPLFYLLNM